MTDLAERAPGASIVVQRATVANAAKAMGIAAKQ